jgi:stalled ribosome rescue protein Dom34
MPHHFHAVVYIDHAVATIFEFAESGMTEHRILASDRNGNIHHKAGSMGSGHAHDSKTYLTAVADALQSSREILIVGHGTAKNEFARFIRDHVPALAPRIMGVETVNHPTNGEIVALARKFFEAKDLMMPQLNKTT